MISPNASAMQRALTERSSHHITASCGSHRPPPYAQRSKTMSVDRAVMMFAGLMVLLSLALGFYVSSYWYLLTAFIGANLMQASVTGFCPAAMVFKKLGCKSRSAFQ
jgi:hypothetical protein